jgi:hypothetical protein
MDVLHSERRSSSALLPKSEAGQGVRYILKNWMALPRYSADPTWRSTITTPSAR